VDEAAEDAPPDSLLGEVGDGLIGPRRLQLAAAMGRRPL